MKYVEYIRAHISTHIAMIYLKGMGTYSGELIGRPFRTILTSNEANKDQSFWYWRQKDVDEMGRFLVENAKDKKWLAEHVELMKKIAADAKDIAKNIKENDLSKLDVNELVKLYHMLREKTERFIALFMEIDSFDIVFEEILRKEIAKLTNDAAEQNEIYSILTTPAQLVFPMNEKLLLYKASQNPKVIDEFLEKFWWTELHWRCGEAKTKESVMEEIKKLDDVNTKIKELENHTKKILELKTPYLKNEEIAKLNEIFETYAVMHDLRKETQMKTVYSLYLLLKEFEKTLRIPLKHLELYAPNDISALAEGKKLNDDEMMKRFECVTIFFDDGELNFKVGKEGIKLREKEVSSAVGEVQDFSGMPASRGKAVGKVKSALGAPEAIKKVEEGDVLVTSMTSPDFVPAMKKAAAIVTNEGGATCHAAIITRELGLPCIVGTKVATKVLKDGMVVEVNANHGIVKVLK